MRLKMNKKQTVLTVVLIALACVVVLPTTAWLFSKTGPLTNLFRQSNIQCEVVEPTGEDGYYQVKNTGEAAAYVRVSVVANWTYTDADGHAHVYYGANHTPTVTLADNWQLMDDGFYYYTSPLSVDTTVDFAMVVADATQAAPTGDHTDVTVQVVAEALQTEPSEAPAEAWGVQLESGTWTTVTTP